MYTHKIEEFDDSDYFEPEVKITGDKNIHARVTSSVEIVCEVDLAEKVLWEKHRNELPINRRVETVGRKNILTLFDLKLEDSGYYICMAENNAGIIRDYVHLEISSK